MKSVRHRRRIPVASALRFVFLLCLAAHGKAQPLPELGPPVRLDQVRSGSLLLSTVRPPDGSDFEAVHGPMAEIATPELLCVIAAAAVFLGWFVVTIANARKPDGKAGK